MIYTHIFNLLALLLMLIGDIVATILILARSSHSLPVQIAVMVGATLIAVSVWLWLLIPVSNWLYLAVFRGTVVTFAQARELTPLFVLNKKFRWFSMRELKEIPRPDRVEYMRKVLAKARADGIIRRSFIGWG